ncbi:hypothetical protein P8625_00145 [Tenacibaculum tangerinum]|uniref:Lipoprotein n=1 Tax=Tenacibaculum tangerinum TaxID=3038772 RepID=A0ABY8L2E3_9FLAO|nr:hypothetical protein [Tenacibaculum tangerinum]WGH75607.1 hypothetical protein P8625_00145 [Tenacibaculum tangerinum]
MKSKRNPFTNLLKIGLLLFGFSLLLWNCEKEEVAFSQEQKGLANYTLEKLNYDDLLKDTEIQKSLPLLEQNFSNSKQYKEEEIAEGLNILTEKVTKITTENVVTWTFQIKKPVLTASYFENFLVKKYQNTFTYFLISYQQKPEVALENPYGKAISYKIPEKYLSLENINLSAKDEFIDWAPPEGGSDDECEGTVYTEIQPYTIP